MSNLAPRPKYPTAKFDTKNKKIGGKIIEPPQDSQATKFGTRELDFWPNGDPVIQTRIVVKNGDNEPQAIYAKGRMAWAITDALAKAGAPDVAVGGELYVWWSSNGEAKGGGQPPKLYEATYTAPEPYDPNDL